MSYTIGVGDDDDLLRERLRVAEELLRSEWNNICAEILDPGSGRRTGPSVRDNAEELWGSCSST